MSQPQRKGIFTDMFQRVFRWISGLFVLRVEKEIRKKYLDKPFQRFYQVVLVVVSLLIAAVYVLALIAIVQSPQQSNLITTEIILIVFLALYILLLFVMKKWWNVGVVIFQIVLMASTIYSAYNTQSKLSINPTVGRYWGQGFAFGFSNWIIFLVLKEKLFQLVMTVHIICFSALYGGLWSSNWGIPLDIAIIFAIYLWKDNILGGVIKDISNLLKEKEEDSKILDILTEGILLINQRKQVLFANRAFKKLFNTKLDKNDDFSAFLTETKTCFKSINARSQHGQGGANTGNFATQTTINRSRRDLKSGNNYRAIEQLNNFEDLISLKMYHLEAMVNDNEVPLSDSPGLGEFEVYEATFEADLHDDEPSPNPEIAGNNGNNHQQLRKRGIEIRTTITTYSGEPVVFLVFGKIPEELIELRSEYKDHLIASISHELLTPVNCIVQLLEAANIDLPEGDIRNNYIKPILCSSQILLYLIKDLVDYSSMQKENLKLDIREINLLDIFEKVKDLFITQAKFKGITLDFVLEPSVPKTLHSDEDRLTNVLINLVSNGLKFTARGHVIFRAFHDIFDARVEQNGVLTFSVEDTGTGMSADELQKLEKILEKPDEPHFITGIRSSKGVCLGLTITQGLLKNLGSDGLAIQTAKSKGSCFTFRLPFIHPAERKSVEGRRDHQNPALMTELERHEEDANLIVLRDQTEIHLEMQPPHTDTNLIDNNNYSGSKCNCKRIIIVDDNEFNILALKTKLKIRGFETIHSFTAKDAFHILTNAFNSEEDFAHCGADGCTKFRLIFMDVDIPDLNGLEATKHILRMAARREIPPIPVVGCSAFNTDEDIKKGYASGMKDYLCKPIAEKALTRVLNRFC